MVLAVSMPHQEEWTRVPFCLVKEEIEKEKAMDQETARERLGVPSRTGNLTTQPTETIPVQQSRILVQYNNDKPPTPPEVEKQDVG